MPRWTETKVIEIIDLSPTTKLFHLETNVDFNETFEPGQFITLELPISEKRRERWRSYSVSNAPSQDGFIELCIVHMPGGKGTTYLFNQISKGDTLRYKGPQGMFTAPKKEYSEVVLVCTGTGIAPFRSMLKYWARQENRPTYRVSLIFGTRTLKDVLYLEELIDLEKHWDGFKYRVALSREVVEDERFYQGYVHPIYLDQCTQKENTLFMICGWSAMIDDAVINLRDKLKIPEKNIVYELYG